jgi:hypothetical protein
VHVFVEFASAGYRQRNMAASSARILPELRNGVFVNPFHPAGTVGNFLKIVWEKKGFPSVPPQEVRRCCKVLVGVFGV